MPNIEIKAKVTNLEYARGVAYRLKTDYLGFLHQIDTYYNTKDGRLKFREINDKEFQLIPYKKDYSSGPMRSLYSVLPTDEPKVVKELLDQLLGTLFVIDKRREVFLVGNVRVHLDEVKGLGQFLEFEAVYSEDTAEAKAVEVQKVQELMQEFGVDRADLMDRSYVDYFINQ